MKRLLFICFLIIGSFAISCTQRRTPDILSKVERYMEVYPDSALLLLNQLTHPEKLQGKQRADYALLLTQARDKNYLDSLQSDSLIKIAVDYYQDSEDHVKKGMALFYYGKVMALKEEPTIAMQAYLDAQIELESTKEYRTQALLQEYIGYLNYDRDMHKIAIDNYRKSIYFSRKVNDTLKIVYGYRNIAHVYFARHNNDSAQWYAEQGIILLKKRNESEVLPSLLQILGLIERSRENFSDAISYLERAIECEKIPSTLSHYYLSLGSIHMQINEFEKAEKCFKREITSKQIYTQAGAYDYLSLLEKRRGNYERALLYREKSDSLLRIEHDEDLRNQILTIQQKYENEKLLMEKQLLEQDNQIQLFFFLSLSLFFIIFIWILVSQIKKKHKKMKERFKQHLCIIKENEQTINHYIFLLAELKQKEDLLAESSREKIGKLNQKILLLANENKEIRENICVNAVFLLDQLKKYTLIVKRMSKNEKYQVFEYVDLLFGNFVSRMRLEYDLTENNTMLAVLLKIGFSSKELMLVFDCELNSVFRMKQRLKDKLRLENTDSLEEFIALY